LSDLKKGGGKFVRLRQNTLSDLTKIAEKSLDNEVRSQNEETSDLKNAEERDKRGKGARYNQFKKK